MSEIQSLIWAHDTSSAYILPQRLIGLLRTQHMHYPTGEPVFHVAKQVIANRMVGLDNVPWFLVDPVNTIIQRIFEMGLISHVRGIADYMFELMNGLNQLSGTKYSDDDSTFDFVWYGLAIGLGLAGVVCIVELVIFHCKCSYFK